MNKRESCNSEYDNQLNIKINKRHFPSDNLQPNFDPRPLSTKYSLLNHPQDNQHVEAGSEPLIAYNKYDIGKTFYPGNARAPTSQFFDNVDVESTLKNQFQPLTSHDGPNYVPDRNSDLFVEKRYQENNESNIHKLPHKVRGTNNKKCNLAPKTFFNHTKYNVKNL